MKRFFFGGAAIFTLLAITYYALPVRQQAPPIKIAALHSLTGTMAISETPLVDAIRLAVEEINDQGGLLGRQIELVVADGASDDRKFAQLAQRLIESDKVSALFGCWTSSCRKAVKPIVEQNDHLFFYPLQYEGLEMSPNIIYIGSVPSQQILPGTHWAMEQFGKRVYLLGSDYVFPHTANLIIRDLVEVSQGEVLAERYVPLGGTDFEQVVAELKRIKPDSLLNTINGDSNLHLFQALLQAGMDSLPVISFSVAEAEMKAINARGYHPQHYAIWSYFQSLNSESNHRFVRAYKERFGAARVTSDPIESSYSAVKLWASAVETANTDDPHQVNRTIVRQSIAAPAGILAVDTYTRHLWKQMRIGHARSDGQFDIIFQSAQVLRPSPYPGYRRIDEWQLLANQLVASQESER